MRKFFERYDALFERVEDLIEPVLGVVAWLVVLLVVLALAGWAWRLIG